MYREDICRISRSDDGKFIVEVMPPKMQEKMTSKGDPMPCGHDIEMKTYIATTEDELIEIIKEYVPADKKKTPADKFDKGYAKG